MRRITSSSTFCTGGFCLLVLGAGVLLADAQGEYQALFGAEDQKVAATRQTADDAAFAGKLVASAKSLGDSPKLQQLLWRKAFAFGSRSAAGHTSALAALDRLIDADETDRADWQAKRLDILQKLYTRSRGPRRKELGTTYLDALLAAAETHADEDKAQEAADLYRQASVVAKYIQSPRTSEILARRKKCSDRAALLRRLRTRIRLLRGQIDKDPKAVAAREQLVLCYLLEADRPAAAAAVLADELPETYRTYVPLAAKPLKDLPETTCLELAGWYASLASKGSATGKVHALLHARACYDQFLDTHAKRDTTVLKARLELDKVEKELARLGAEVIPRSAWVELLGHVDPDKLAMGGKWRREGNTLIGGAAIFNRITIPASVQGDYTLRVLFSRSRGGSDWQAFYVNFPVGRSECSLMIDGHKGTAAGLSDVRGKVLPAPGSPYEPSLLQVNRNHTVEVRVKLLSRGTAQITGRLDGKDLIRWQGPWSVLSATKKAQWKGTFWVGAFWSDVTLRSVKVYVPGGKPKILKGFR